jgi:hypothetical protein
MIPDKNGDAPHTINAFEITFWFVFMSAIFILGGMMIFL